MIHRYAPGHCPDYNTIAGLPLCACGDAFAEWDALVDHCRRPMRVATPVCVVCGTRLTAGRWCADCTRERAHTVRGRARRRAA